MTWKVRNTLNNRDDRYVEDSDERLDGVDMNPISSSNEHQA